jgi:hypothetical protein
MSMGLGGPLGAGGYFQPNGPRGPWMGCGCSGCLMMIAGIILVMSGCLRMLGH